MRCLARPTAASLTSLGIFDQRLFLLLYRQLFHPDTCRVRMKTDLRRGRQGCAGRDDMT